MRIYWWCRIYLKQFRKHAKLNYIKNTIFFVNLAQLHVILFRKRNQFFTPFNYSLLFKKHIQTRRKIICIQTARIHNWWWCELKFWNKSYLYRAWIYIYKIDHMRSRIKKNTIFYVSSKIYDLVIAYRDFTDPPTYIHRFYSPMISKIYHVERHRLRGIKLANKAARICIINARVYKIGHTFPD